MKITKRIILSGIFIVSIILFIIFLTTYSKNKIAFENDFESGTEGFFPNGNASLDINNEYSYYGNYSLKISGGIMDWHGARILGKNTGISLDEEYELSAMVYSESELQVVLQITLIRMDGTKEYKWLEDSILVPNEWIHYTSKLTLDSSKYSKVDSISFENKTEPFSASYYLDSVKIIESKKMTLLNIVIISMTAVISGISFILLLLSFLSGTRKDALTGTYARDIIENDLPIIINKASVAQKDICLIMADLDRFKSVNDTYGHAAGDIVLKNLAGIIHQCIRSKDWVSRYGGEEFLIFLSNSDKEIGKAVAERIRKKLENTVITVDGKDISVTASFGVASLQDDNLKTAQEMLKLADQNLYTAKNSGRNKVC